MKISTYILTLIATTIIACSRKNSKEDNILLTEVEPMIHITSVDTIIDHASGCGYVPYPEDSIANVSFDINNDGIDDYTITCSSWYHWVSASGPCANYNTNIVISGTSDKNKISIGQDFNIVKRYNTNEIIDNSQQWSKTATLMMSSATGYFTTNFNDTNYLGLKINTDEGEQFGWVYIDKDEYDVSIISYALNLTENNSINAGQIK